MSIHSIQIDQSMQNWQVSGGSAYWFRCIPNRLGCIATVLISKTARIVRRTTVESCTTKARFNALKLLRLDARISAQHSRRCCKRRQPML